MTKVVHLSSVHKADDVRIFYKECRSLAKAGYDVVLIARADEDYERDGVQIRAVGGGAGNRLARMTRTVWQVYRMALAENGDIYHFHDPELIPVGIVLKLRGKQVIYDAHEDVPGQIRTKHWIPSSLRGLVSRIVGAIEAVGVRFFDAVVTATPGIARHFPPKKTTVVQNFPLLDEIAPNPIPGNQSQEGGHRIIYTGGLTAIRGAREMVQAMETLGPKGVRLTIAGVIRPSSLESELKQMPGWNYVDFVGWQARSSMAQYLSDAQVGLVLFHPAPNHAESQPNKLFEYMAAGLPVVASDFPFWEQFVKVAGTGRMADPLDPAAVAKEVKWLLENPNEATVMGERGRDAVISRYSWEQQAAVLTDLYASLR